MVTCLLEWAARVKFWWFCVFVGSTASAQILGEYDFENGFDSLRINGISSATRSVTRVGAAAHRGQLGARLEKQVANEAGTGPILAFRPALPQDALYLRAWFRWNRVDPTTDALNFLAIHRATPSGTVVGLVLRHHPTQDEFEVDMNGLSDLDAGQSSTRTSTFPLGVFADRDWHLWELAAVTDGTFVQTAVAVDGRVVLSRRTPNQSTGGLTYTETGHVYQYSELFGGQFDFDDLRFDDAPLPSRWRLTGPEVLQRGACTAVRAELADVWDGGVATTSQPAELTLEAQGVDVFLDSTCATTGAITVPANASSVTFYARAKATPLSLRGSSVDLLPSNVLEPTLGPGDYRIACDCSAGVGGGDLVLVALLGLTRRRR